MDELLILLQAKLDEAKSKGNVIDDIDKIQRQLDKLKLQVEIDPKSISNITKQLESILNQKIVISNIGINNEKSIKEAQQTGKQMGTAVSQGMASASKATDKILRDFSELNDAKRQFVDNHDLISKDDISDAEKFYDTVRKAFSEFGQVTVNKGEMTDGILESMRVKIEQVNSEAKITRDFMLYFNKADDFGNNFTIVDDDTIRSTEKMIQHLNEEKNIINATSEEANAIKERLAEQEKFYKNIKNEVSNLYSLKTKLLSADELQTAELEKQVKQTKERIRYNNKQIDKKGLRDNSLDYDVNSLEVEKQKQYAIAKARKQDIVVAKSQAQAQREVNSALKEQQVIQSKLNNGDYDKKFESLKASYERLGLTSDEVKSKTSEVSIALDKLKSQNIDTLVQDEKEFANALKKSQNEAALLKLDLDSIYNPKKQIKLSNNIQDWLSKNSRASKDAKDSLNTYYRELNGGRVSVSRLDYIEQELKNVDTLQRKLGRLGKSLTDQFKEAGRSFTQWLSVSSGVMLFISKIRSSITELKEVNNIMTEISKTADQLSKADLSNIEKSSYNTASKYGKKASNYLIGIQEMYRAGYENAEDLAELSTLAQAAGDMQADLANDYLIATDAAYKLKGNTEALNAVLDGQNYITNRNALSMQDLAEATKIAASQSASSGIAIDQATAAMGTMIATTRQGGDVAARAWKGILMNLQQVEGEVEEGDILDSESLTKYEKACADLGVSLKEVKNGVVSLRDPMKILKELSEAYTSLDDSDARRANLISAVGGKYRGNQLNALLENWTLYEKMLKDYAAGSGSAMEEAMKSANNWEGSLNRLSNTFTKVVNNFVNSDFVVGVTNGFNGLLSIVDKVTSKLGSLGSLGAGAGIFAGLKNVGMAGLY